MGDGALIDQIEEAIDHARALGLNQAADRADSVVDNLRSRVGLTGDAYALALIGGTGVGKSTLVNAIAGEEVSEASVRRPTTDRPVAWLSAGTEEAAAPLVEWLGVARVVSGDDADRLDGVIVLDLPDFDSVVSSHRETVDRLLPRLDAVWWVVDPQKYDDERLFEYLRKVRSDASVRIVLNKADLLTKEEVEDVTRDIQRRLAAEGLSKVTVSSVSARTGADVDDLIDSVASGAEAKKVVLERLRSDALEAVDGLGDAAGVASDEDGLITGQQLEAWRGEVVSAAMDLADPEGISRQVATAYLEKARVSAGSILSRLGSLVRLATGNRRRSANPGLYMKSWRRRGDPSRAVNVLRRTYLEATRRLPPASRSGLMDDLDPEAAGDSIARALDDALRRSADGLVLRPPVLWRLFGVIQLLATAAVVVAGVWFLTLWLAPGPIPVGSWEIPVVGPVPVPLALLAGGAVLSFVVGGIVRLHGAWLGRRRAREVADSVAESVGAAIQDHGFARLIELDSHRRGLGRLVEAVRREASSDTPRLG